MPYDPRFPATNQARNCYTRYNEYYKCIQEKEESSPDCMFYQKAYRSLCPSEWVRHSVSLSCYAVTSTVLACVGLTQTKIFVLDLCRDCIVSHMRPSFPGSWCPSAHRATVYVYHLQVEKWETAREEGNWFGKY